MVNTDTSVVLTSESYLYTTFMYFTGVRRHFNTYVYVEYVVFY